MESNWRYNIWASGLTAWALDPSGQFGQKWRFLARLSVPFFHLGFLIEAVAMLDLGVATQIVLVVLLEGTYPVGYFNAGIAYDTPFPGGFNVIPDHPAVPW